MKRQIISLIAAAGLMLGGTSQLNAMDSAFSACVVAIGAHSLGTNIFGTNAGISSRQEDTVKVKIYSVGPSRQRLQQILDAHTDSDGCLTSSYIKTHDATIWTVAID